MPIVAATLLAHATCASAFALSPLAVSPAASPVRPRGAPATMFFDVLLPTKAPEVPWAAAYKQSDINALWMTLKKCYGSESAARAAVKQNNQVICPLYSTPAQMTKSYQSLIKVVGKKDALSVMAMNPAVLTCGDLTGQDPNEIKRIASARRGMDGFARFLQGQM